MSKKDRKAFNFFKSYFDVYNELDDKAKVEFIDSLLNRQFYGIEPEGLKGFTKLAYISQKHNIDAQVKGFEDKTGFKLTPPTEGASEPPTAPPTVQVIGKGEVIVIEKEKEQKVYSQAIQDSYKRILVNFPTQLQPKNKKTQNEWLDTLEKLERIDKIPLQEVEKIVKATRQDDFWAKNFMSLTKLRKKNPDNLSYIVVFNEKINKNGQQNGSTETRTPNERAREIFLKRREQQNNAS